MEIPHATFDQVLTGKNGKLVSIGADVMDIARQLHEIDPALRVFYNETGMFYEVKEIVAPNAEYPRGQESLVTTVPHDGLNPSLVAYMRYLSKQKNFADRIEKAEAEKKRAKDYALEQQTSETGERMAHAVRKDLEHKGKVFVSKELDGTA